MEEHVPSVESEVEVVVAVADGSVESEVMVESEGLVSEELGER